MNNKLLLSIISIAIICLLIVGYGISRWQRAQILQGERDVVLIDKKTNSYSFLSSSMVDDIENRAKIAGFVDEFTAQELAELVKGLQFSGSGIGPGSPKVPSIEVQSPEEDELEAWNALVGTLSSQQSSLCNSMPIADLAQFCVIQHILFEAKKNNQSADAVCSGIFIQDYAVDCEETLSEASTKKFIDKDANSLLDSFELYTGKAEQFRS